MMADHRGAVDLGPVHTDPYGRKRGGLAQVWTCAGGVVCWSNDWTALVLAAIEGHPRLEARHYPAMFGHMDVALKACEEEEARGKAEKGRRAQHDRVFIARPDGSRYRAMPD